MVRTQTSFYSSQIHIDIPRTNPLIPLFQQPLVQEVSVYISLKTWQVFITDISRTIIFLGTQATGPSKFQLGIQNLMVMLSTMVVGGSRDGVVVRALASHQCGPGLIPGLGAICGLSLLLVLVFVPKAFLRVLWFSPI